MATDPRAETIRLLTSIDATMKQIANLIAASMAVGLTGTGSAPAVAAAMSPTVDLDNAHGNPVVKAKDPRDWSGEPMTGRTFSECPPEYLDLLADRFDYFAGKEPDEKKAGYNRLDARRARGWAARKRAGWTASVATGGFSDEAGF